MSKFKKQVNYEDLTNYENQVITRIRHSHEE